MKLTWMSLGLLFPRGKRRGLQAEVRLGDGYRRVFLQGGDSAEDRELVLADLARASGFYRVTPAAGADTKQLWQREGMRMLYAEIQQHLTVTGADLHALEVAARREAAIDEDEKGTR